MKRVNNTQSPEQHRWELWLSRSERHTILRYLRKCCWNAGISCGAVAPEPRMLQCDRRFSLRQVGLLCSYAMFITHRSSNKHDNRQCKSAGRIKPVLDCRSSLLSVTLYHT